MMKYVREEEANANPFEVVGEPEQVANYGVDHTRRTLRSIIYGHLIATGLTAISAVQLHGLIIWWAALQPALDIVYGTSLLAVLVCPMSLLYFISRSKLPVSTVLGTLLLEALLIGTQLFALFPSIQ